MSTIALQVIRGDEVGPQYLGVYLCYLECGNPALQVGSLKFMVLSTAGLRWRDPTAVEY
jgi:hypothetical protein